MATPAPSTTQPWYAGPLFHYLTGFTAIAAAILWMKLGGDPGISTGAFIGGIAFLGVGVGTSAASSASP